MVAWSANRRDRSAFTLLEVLLVVGGIALLISILMPSLAKAREQARSAQCLSNLKQMGTSTVMYTVDNRSYLPGPLHPAVYKSTYDAYYRSKDANGPMSADWRQDRLYRRTQLVHFISRYYGEKGRSGALADKVATCPTADLLQNKNLRTLAPGFEYQRPFHYVVNSIKADKTACGSNRPGNGPPYVGTKVPLYFGLRLPGMSNSEWSGVAMNEASRTTLGQRQPKQIDIIRQGSREWAYADVWYSEVGSVWTQTAGPWPYFNGKERALARTASSSISVYNSKTKTTNYIVPTYPYHNTIKTWPSDARWVTESKLKSHPRFSEGRTNAAFFDGHAAAERVWQGTVNPCWSGDTTCEN